MAFWPTSASSNEVRRRTANNDPRGFAPVVTLSEMRRLLDARGLQLTKSLGQNFLHDANQLQRIVAAGALGPGDRVLEIGPGLGPLTQAILDAGVAEVLAIEKDARLIPLLTDQFQLDERLTVLHADALETIRTERRRWSDWKLVANLPYSVGSAILVELALAEHPPERLTVTLQFEVVQRILATADTDHYGVLTLLLSQHFRTGNWFKIPRDCFFPIPDVDSACVTLLRRPAPLLPGELAPKYVRLVKLGFSQRRKMMFKLLKQEWPVDRLTAAFARARIALTERAEKVSPEQFAVLTRELTGA